VHINGAGIPAHDGRAADKRDVISAIDRAFFGEVLQRIDLRDTLVAVTADHSTSCLRKAHTDDPVPLLVAGGPVTSDGSPSYGETIAARGSLGTMRGPEIVPMLVRMMRE
jgi:2,3-bisphosphoglycerate-independent phosphoglycerate mutase